jgi:chromate transporter
MSALPPGPPDADPPAPGGSARLGEVATLFLRLGLTAFGGPAAHVAIMEREVVGRRRWVSPERFLDLFGAASLLPGPSSSELAVYLGYERAGWPGLVVAGACFVLPAALLTGLLAWGYGAYGALPDVGGALYGIKPVVVAIVVQALVGLTPKAVKSRWLGVVGALAGAAELAGASSLAVLLGAGVVMASSRRLTGGRGDARTAAPALLAGTPAVAAAAPAGVLGIFLVFLKIGAVVFGSGYVLVAFLHDDLVVHRHWLSDPQLLDAVAVGQITPGPVFTTATFLGYLLLGVPGAIAATVAIFLPGFVLVAMSRPLVARVRRSPTAGAFLDGVNVASLALMAVVTLELGRTALVDARTVAIAVSSAVLLLRLKVGSGWVIAGGAAAGIVLRHLAA